MGFLAIESRICLFGETHGGHGGGRDKEAGTEREREKWTQLEKNSASALIKGQGRKTQLRLYA